MDLNLRHWHKIGSEPSESTFPPECCVQRFGVEADRIDQEAARAREEAVHAERRRVVLEAVAGIETYWNAAASVLPPDDPGTQLAAAVVKQCLNTVSQTGCICPTLGIPTYADPGATTRGFDPRCGLHGGK